jgi:hypothetical protein
MHRASVGRNRDDHGRDCRTAWVAPRCRMQPAPWGDVGARGALKIGSCPDGSEGQPHRLAVIAANDERCPSDSRAPSAVLAAGLWPSGARRSPLGDSPYVFLTGPLVLIPCNVGRRIAAAGQGCGGSGGASASHPITSPAVSPGKSRRTGSPGRQLSGGYHHSTA